MTRTNFKLTSDARRLDETNPAHLVLWTLEQDLRHAERKLAGAAMRLREAADRIDRALADGRTLNELGELQGIPSDVETAVARRDQAQRTLGLLADGFGVALFATPAS